MDIVEFLDPPEDLVDIYRCIQPSLYFHQINFAPEACQKCGLWRLLILHEINFSFTTFYAPYH
jgi:hypothetical protein